MKLAFKIISYVEGISAILLFFVAVPLKYLAHNDAWVKAIGMPHGILFVIYCIAAVAIYFLGTFKWSVKTLLIALIAAIVPLGTFYVDRKYC